MDANIRQHAVFNAQAKRIYEILLDTAAFSAFTGGAAAQIDPRAGGAFSMFGGMIAGRTIELAPYRRIVQAWRVGNWPEGVYSIVRFDLDTVGAATRLTLTQTGFPEDDREHLASGWPARYFEPLRAYLG